MNKKQLAPITVTGPQREWLEKEKQRTGNAFSTIMRNLIQEKVNAEIAKKEAE